MFLNSKSDEIGVRDSHYELETSLRSSCKSAYLKEGSWRRCRFHLWIAVSVYFKTWNSGCTLDMVQMSSIFTAGASCEPDLRIFYQISCHWRGWGSHWFQVSLHAAVLFAFDLFHGSQQPFLISFVNQLNGSIFYCVAFELHYIKAFCLGIKSIRICGCVWDASLTPVHVPTMVEDHRGSRNIVRARSRQEGTWFIQVQMGLLSMTAQNLLFWLVFHSFFYGQVRFGETSLKPHENLRVLWWARSGHQLPSTPAGRYLASLFFIWVFMTIAWDRHLSGQSLWKCLGTGFHFHAAWVFKGQIIRSTNVCDASLAVFYCCYYMICSQRLLQRVATIFHLTSAIETRFRFTPEPLDLFYI